MSCGVVGLMRRLLRLVVIDLICLVVVFGSFELSVVLVYGRRCWLWKNVIYELVYGFGCWYGLERVL